MPSKGNSRLGLVQDVKDDQVVPGEPEPVKRPEDRFRVAQQVAEEHDQAAMPEHAGDLVQTRLELGRSLGLELGQERKDVAELRTLAARREALG